MTCVASGDGLINPDLFPCRAEGLDTSRIEASADKLRAMGKAVDSCASDVDRVWKGLPSVYRSPSADAAYGLMGPAVVKAGAINESFSKAADALDSYASSLSGVRQELQDLEDEAREFRREAEAGYDEPRVHLRTGLTTGVDHKSWKEHEPAVQRNKDLLDRYARLLERISGFAADCADLVNGLVSGAQPQKAERVSAQDIMNAPTPWGAPVDRDPSCPESVGAGVVNFAKSTWEGGASLLGFNENGWSSTTFVNSWAGVGDFVVSTVVATSPLSRALLTVVGNDEVDAWLERRVDVAAMAWGGMIGFDWQAQKSRGDGWHRYREEDGIAVFTESVLNVGSLFVPGAGQAGAGLKIVAQGTRLSKLSKLAKVANVAGAGAEMLFTGGSWAVKAGATGLGKLISATDSLLDTIAPSVKGLDSPAGGGGKSGLPGGKGPSVDGTPSPSLSSSSRGVRPGAGLVNAAHGSGGSGASAALGLDGSGPGGARPAGGSGVKPPPPPAGLDPHNRPRAGDTTTPETPDGARPDPDGARPDPGPDGARPDPGVRPESDGSGSRASRDPEAETPRRRSSEAGDAGPGRPRRAAPEHTPAARDPQPRPEPEPEPRPEPETRPESESRPSPEPESRPGSRPDSESQRGPEQRPDPEPRPEPEPESRPRSRPESESQRGPEQRPDPEPRPEPETQPSPESRPDSESQRGPETRSEPETRPQPQPEPETRPESESRSESESRPDAGSRRESGSGRWDRPGPGRFVDDAARAADAADSAPSPEPGVPASDGDVVPSVEDVVDQRLAEPGQTPDVDHPGYDTDGNPLKTDRGDGRAHYANDPEGTYRILGRDGKQRLHWLDNGDFVTDSYAGKGEIEHVADYSTQTREWTNPEYAEMFERDVAVWEEARTAARRDRAAALDAMNQAANLTIDGKPAIDITNKSFNNVAEQLRKFAKDHPGLADKAEALMKTLDDAGDSAQRLRETSEWVGDRAGYLRSLDQSRTVLVGRPGETVADHAGPGAGAVDQVSIDHDRVYVGENKGGDNPALGSRATEDGRAQQGTLQYLRDLLTGKNPDSRLVEALEALKDSPEHAEFYRKLTTEGVEVVYEMVNARSNGTVKVGQFDLQGPVKLKLVDGQLVLDAPASSATRKGTP